MEIKVNQDNNIELTKVYSGISLKTDSEETMHICMRDTGFEFNYQGTWYSAQNGTITKLRDSDGNDN